MEERDEDSKSKDPDTWCSVQPRPHLTAFPINHQLLLAITNPKSFLRNRKLLLDTMMLSSSQTVVYRPASVAVVPAPLLGLQQVSWRWQSQRAGSKLTLAKQARNPKGLVRCQVTSVNQENFEQEVLHSELPVLVDFWAKWCGPCKLVATSVDALDRKYAGKLKVVKVETDPNPELKEKYKVYGLPTLIMFRNGEVMAGGRYEGAISLDKLDSMITKVLPSLAAAN